MRSVMWLCVILLATANLALAQSTGGRSGPTVGGHLAHYCTPPLEVTVPSREIDDPDHPFEEVTICLFPDEYELCPAGATELILEEDPWSCTALISCCVELGARPQ